MTGHLLEQIPTGALYLLTVLAMLATTEVGYRLSRALRQKSTDKPIVGLGGIVGASLALLAFLLAFVVGLGATIHAERRHLIVAEANAIGTTSLRASLLDEPYRSEAKTLLREYTDLRLAAVDPAQRAAAVTRSEHIHEVLWGGAVKAAAESPLPTTSLYISSLNDVIDRHAERVAVGVDIRIPPLVIIGLYGVALFTTFLVGMQSGRGEKRNTLAQVVLTLILSLVFLLIVDLDRAQGGLIQVSELPMIDLQRQLNASP